jgi:hypothetical protein
VGSLYRTSEGAVFTRVSFKQFGSAWRDPEGNIWSANLGRFNFLPDAQETPGKPHSAAMVACEKIGGRLPSLDEYKKLLAYFLIEQPEVWSRDLQTLFPDWGILPLNRGEWFWAYSDAGGRLVIGTDTYGDIGYRSLELSVRCIGR